MNILITGGTGFIGRHLISKLHYEHDITVLTRDQQNARRILPDNVSIITKLDAMGDFSSLDAVINLAGEPIADSRWTDKQKQRICHSRWDITEELVTRIKQAVSPPAVFISGSAIGYYGRQGDTPVTEDNPQVHEEFTHELCARWEAIAEQAASEQTRVCLLRTGIVLAKGEGALDRMVLPFKLGLGGKMGNGEQFMSWIHIEDMVEGIRFLLIHEKCRGPYNLTAPHPVTNRTFTHTLAKELHRPALFTVPGFALKLVMGEAAELLLTGQKVIPKRLQDAGYEFSYPLLEDALRQEF